MYSEINYRTKKALKEAVKSGVQVGVFQPNDMFGNTEKYNKGEWSITLEGPHYPEPHTWYAQVEIKDGIITKVR